MGQIDKLSILLKIKEDRFTSLELHNLIKYTYSIAKSILRNNFINKLYLQKKDFLTVEDVAMDSITQLFVKNSNNELGIKKTLLNWNDNIDSEADADYFIHKLVWSRIEQTITKIIKDRDPIFSKIHKTLSICINKFNYNKINHLGTIYIVQDNNTNIQGTVIDEKFFDSIPESIFELKQNKLCDALFSIIVNESDNFPAIPFNDLIKRIKKHHFIQYKNSQTFFSESEENIHYGRIIENSIETLTTKIENFYVAKEKISGEEAELIKASFNDISKDLMNGGINSSLFSYLKYQKNTLTKDEFYSKYHHIMNYLFSEFKKNIAKQI